MSDTRPTRWVPSIPQLLGLIVIIICVGLAMLAHEIHPFLLAAVAALGLAETLRG